MVHEVIDVLPVDLESTRFATTRVRSPSDANEFSCCINSTFKDCRCAADEKSSASLLLWPVLSSVAAALANAEHLSMMTLSAPLQYSTISSSASLSSRFLLPDRAEEAVEERTLLRTITLILFRSLVNGIVASRSKNTSAWSLPS